MRRLCHANLDNSRRNRTLLCYSYIPTAKGIEFDRYYIQRKADTFAECQNLFCRNLKHKNDVLGY